MFSVPTEHRKKRTKKTIFSSHSQLPNPLRSSGPVRCPPPPTTSPRPPPIVSPVLLDALQHQCRLPGQPTAVRWIWTHPLRDLLDTFSFVFVVTGFMMGCISSRSVRNRKSHGKLRWYYSMYSRVLMISIPTFQSEV